MFCLLVILVELSVLAKWSARKTPLRKPNRGEGIVSRKPRPKSAHDFLGLLYCFIVLLSICVVACPYVIYYPTVMARYSLSVLKVPLNASKQTNQIPSSWVRPDVCDRQTSKTKASLNASALRAWRHNNTHGGRQFTGVAWRRYIAPRVNSAFDLSLQLHWE